MKRYTLQECEQKAAQWLNAGNEAKERGEKEKAERHYSRSQIWLDRMNVALGNDDGSDK